MMSNYLGFIGLDSGDFFSLIVLRTALLALAANAVRERHTGSCRRQEADAIEAPPALLGHVGRLERPFQQRHRRTAIR